MTALRKGYVTEAEADLKSKVIKSEQDYWQEQLSNIRALPGDREAAAEKFVVQSKSQTSCLITAVLGLPLQDQGAKY